MAHNQFELLKQRRFLPYFLTQSLGAFNDNVYRQAIIGLLFYLGAERSAERTLYANLAPALFILPYFLFSATAGQIAEKLEKSRLIRITTMMEIAIMSLAAVGFLTAEHAGAAGGAVLHRRAVHAVRAGEVFDPAAGAASPRN